MTMVVRRTSSALEARQTSGSSDSNNNNRGGGNYTVTIIIAVVVIVVLTIASISWTYLRRKRARGQVPKFLPGFLHKRWESWNPRQKYATVDRGRQQSFQGSTSYNGAETEERAASNAAAAGVDRNTSIRSVMTLPPYSHAPQASEQVLGREGERAGMDSVVEYPETHEEEENRREDQMESLYQIRLQRRREVAEREERRRERREARERGDFARLEELRRDSRSRANNESTSSLNGGLDVSAATMIAEHQSRSRDRRVSSVAYADIGHVRHDGTRIRANSSESERGGLLDNAAPMGDDGSSLHPSLRRPSHQGRERSGSSALSISTNASDIEPTPPTTQTGDSSHPHTSDDTTSDSSPTATRFTPEGSTEGEGEVGESHIQPASTTTMVSPTLPPPEYQPPEEWGDAPAYSERMASIRRSQAAGGVHRTGSQRAFDEMSRSSTFELPPPSSSDLTTASRAETGAPQLPALNLPSISVEDASAPGSPVSPLVGSAEAQPVGQGRAGESARGRDEVRRSRWGGNEDFMA